jgi:hemoglobin-like flavoprotein
MLMAMIATAVNGLGRLNEIVPAVEALGRRHVGYAVGDTHYEIVGAVQPWTLEQGLGAAFATDVKAAWAVCYGTLPGV